MITVTLDGVTKIFPRAGTVVDAADLRIDAGEFFTLLGPSGCGKSTLLRMIGGFERPSGGRILFDGRDVTDEPPNRRGIGFVFQNYALFPHLSVAENVAFGLQIRKIGRRETTDRVRRALDEVKLGECGAERVDRLSGGQQQRVALARALVVGPRLLLLDEPLSNLDAALRQDARALLRRIHERNGATIVYVTHDQAEAMTMSDRIGILRGGRIHQIASPETIYARPATAFVAGFVGRNNVLEAAIARMAGDRPVVRFADGTEMTVEATGSDAAIRIGARVGVCVRPEAFRFGGDGAFHGIVASTEYAGPTSSCEVTSALGMLHVDLPAGAGRPSRGEHVRLGVHPSALHLIHMEARS